MNNIFLSGTMALVIALSGASLSFFNLSPFALVGYFATSQEIPRTEVSPQALDRGIEQCVDCKIILYGTVWEVMFKMPAKWHVGGSEPLMGNNIRHVISANGTQWYFLDKASGDGELGHMYLYGENNESISFVFYRKLPEPPAHESVKDFNAVGFKGKIYQANADRGGGKTLYFELPDKKYGIGVMGKGEDFDNFIKDIGLGK